MDTSVVYPGGNQNALYWYRRGLELTRTSNALYAAVTETKSHQTVLAMLSPTDKIGSETWESAMSNAKACLTRARTLRTKFRKQVYAIRDTLRVHKQLAQDCPPSIIEAVELGVKYLDFLEAHGF